MKKWWNLDFLCNTLVSFEPKKSYLIKDGIENLRFKFFYIYIYIFK